MDHPVYTRVGIHRVHVKKVTCASVSGKRIPITCLHLCRKKDVLLLLLFRSGPKKKKQRIGGSHDVVKLFGRVGVTVMAGVRPAANESRAR